MFLMQGDRDMWHVDLWGLLASKQTALWFQASETMCLMAPEEQHSRTFISGLHMQVHTVHTYTGERERACTNKHN